jgi:hypothetical protein
MKSGLALMFLAALPVVGCAPAADFGRRPSGVVEERIVPATGSVAARLRGDPVSRFALTDEEQRFRAGAHALIAAPDILGPIAGIGPRLREARWLSGTTESMPYNTYYRKLMWTGFASSEGRLSRFIGDMEKDIAAMVPFRAQAQAVLAGDALRRQMLDAPSGLTPRARRSAEARIQENLMVIESVLSALYWRGHAYAYALEHLAVETPTGRLDAAAESYFRLKQAIEAFEAAMQSVARGGVLESLPDHSAVVQENSLARPR